MFDDKGWARELEGASGVVSCIGAFGSNAFMERINGDANAHAAEVAAKAGELCGCDDGGDEMDGYWNGDAATNPYLIGVRRAQHHFSPQYHSQTRATHQ